MPGHEICGEVIAVGAGVGAECPHKVRDVVLVYPWTGCRQCEYCDAQLSHMCPNNKTSTTDIGRGYKGSKHGGFQSIFPLEEWSFAIKLPDSIPPYVGCMMPCSGITSYTALEKCRPALEFGIKTRKRARLLIVGMGGLGGWALVIAKTLYGNNVDVTCADAVEDKMASATEMRADHTILLSPNQSTDDVTQLFTARGKYDACIDIVGIPKTVEACFWSLQNAGVAVVIGIGGGKLSLATPTLVGRCISIIGSRTGSIEMVRQMVDLFAEKGFYKLPPLEYVTLRDVNDVFERMKSGAVQGRAIIKFV